VEQFERRAWNTAEWVVNRAGRHDCSTETKSAIPNRRSEVGSLDGAFKLAKTALEGNKGILDRFSDRSTGAWKSRVHPESSAVDERVLRVAGF